MINARKILLTLLAIATASCSGSQRNFEFPRTSFVQLKQLVTIKTCKPGNPFECADTTSGISGSGSIVKVTKVGSFVLTAEHVCNSATLANYTRGKKVNRRDFYAIDLYGKEYNLKVVGTNVRFDLCLVFANGLISHPAIPISKKPPEPGKRFYNVASPMGVFNIDMVPAFSGHFAGSDGENDIYSIPAHQGSSGSPVLNDRGEIVGVITRTFSNFNNMSRSPSYNDLSAFLSTYL